ncbi:hypothetical protein vseg_018035 [Gypsophila vaccaria]
MADSTTYNSVYKDPLHLTSGDQSLLQIIPQVFSGKSFMHWSRNLKMALVTKNKLGFITGTYPKPAATHANHNDWIRTDYTAMRWILNSLSDTIAESLSYVSSSKQLWDELDERYNQSNAPYLYQLRKDVVQIAQGELSVAEYYSRLKSVWEDIRSLDPLPECNCGAIDTCSCNLLKKIVERDNKNNLIDLLMGLANKYENIRGQILAMDPLPTVNQAFAKIHQAEVQKNITNTDPSIDIDAMAMAVVPPSVRHAAVSDFSMSASANSSGFSTPNVWKRDSKKPKGERPSYFCDFCNKPGHTKDFCWKLKNPKSKSSTGSYRTNSYPGKRFAANVEETPIFQRDTPCDDTPSLSSVQALDSTFVQAVARELFKLQTSGSVSSSPNFAVAGPFN